MIIWLYKLWNISRRNQYPLVGPASASQTQKHPHSSNSRSCTAPDRISMIFGWLPLRWRKLSRKSKTWRRTDNFFYTFFPLSNHHSIYHEDSTYIIIFIFPLLLALFYTVIFDVWDLWDDPRKNITMECMMQWLAVFKGTKVLTESQDRSNPRLNLWSQTAFGISGKQTNETNQTNKQNPKLFGRKNTCH